MQQLVWSDQLGNRSRLAHLVLRKGERLIRFIGESVPGVVAVVSQQYQKQGKWSHTTYRLMLANEVVVAFNHHSGWETATIMEPLGVDDWSGLARELGVPDNLAFRQFVQEWRPEDALILDEREQAILALEEETGGGVMNLDYEVKLNGETMAAFLCRQDADQFLERWDVPGIYQRSNLDKNVKVELTWKPPALTQRRLVEAFGYDNVKIEEKGVCKLFS